MRRRGSPRADPATATITAVGDLQLGDSSIRVGFGLRSRYPDGASLERLFSGISGQLAGADIVFGNLECTLSQVGDRPNDWRAHQMRGLPEYAHALRRLGFTLLNVANNHAVQHGVRAFEETVAILRSHGLTPCGLCGEAPWQCEPVVLELARADVGVLSYCLRPRQYEAAVTPPFAEGTREGICSDVARLRTEVDAVVVSLHWGDEFVQLPSVSDVALGNAILGAGATLIVGHHPHVSRPVVRRATQAVAYSLGNCATDMSWYEPLRNGLLLRATVQGDRVEELAVLPLRNDDEFRPSAAGPWRDPSAGTEALEPDPYRDAVDSTWSSQRTAGYAFVLRNAFRFHPMVLARLLATTVRNKITAAP